jgi:hypothetical protein
MGRLALLLALLAAAVQAQPPGVLRITVTIVDADGRARPVPRHGLLISDNPVSAAPQRIVTTIDGIANVRLRPGNYTIESDEPLIFQGKSYEWVQTLDVPAGRDTTIELTAANAEISAPAAAAGGGGAAGAASALLLDWQGSIVTIWSPTRVGSGFVIDARGLIATNQRLVGNAAWVEVQLSPTKKLAARVLAADPDRDVAVVWVDAGSIAAVRPMKLATVPEGAPAIAEKEKVFAIEAPLDDRTSLASAVVGKITASTLATNINIDERSAGTPLLNAAGDVVAITTTIDDGRDIPDVAQGSVRIDRAGPVIAEAEKRMAGAAPPPAAALPVEPGPPVDDEILRTSAQKRAGEPGAYMVPAEDFDVSVITPAMLYGARRQGERTTGRDRGRPDANPEETLKAMRSLQGFANWDDYVNDYPPVVLIRATPKLVEGFWSSLARGAAQSQGVSLPPNKHLKAGFSAMRLSCGTAEITPVHPFKIAQRVGARDVVYEGLYAFDPGAIGPHCRTVTLTLFSEKTPDKGDPRVLDARIVQQVWDDFAVYRSAAPPAK